MTSPQPSTVSIVVDRGRLRLRWRFAGQQYRISLQLPDTAVNRRYALRVAQQIELDILAGRFDRTLNDYKPRNSESEEGFSIYEIWNRFLAAKGKDVKAKTLEKYEVTAKTLVDFFPGRLANSISDKDAEKFVEWIRTEAKVPQTGKRLSADQKFRRIQEVLACWTWAIKQGLVNQNPWLEMPKRIKVPPVRKPNPFTEEEIELILMGMEEDQRYQHFVLYAEFLLGTGCRPGEVVGLRWGSVSEDCSSIWIGETMVRGQRESTKNNKERILNLSDSLQQMLLKTRPTNPDPEELVFKSQRGMAIDVHNFRNRAWKDTLERVGIPYRKPYNTRSTFTSHSLEQGVSPLVVAEMTGHDVQVLYKHYAESIKGAPKLPEIRRNRKPATPE